MPAPRTTPRSRPSGERSRRPRSRSADPCPWRGKPRRSPSARRRCPPWRGSGWPPSTSTPAPGAAISVPGPFSRTMQSKRSTARRTASSRCASTQDDSSPISRPELAGVRRQHPRRGPVAGLELPERVSVDDDGERRLARARVGRMPSSPRCARARARPRAPPPSRRARATVAAASSVDEPVRVGGQRPLHRLEDPAARRPARPARARRASRSRRRRGTRRAPRGKARPLIPGEPPATTTWPGRRTCCPRGCRRGTSSRIDRVTRAFSVSAGSSPMSATSSSPRGTAPGVT